MLQVCLRWQLALTIQPRSWSAPQVETQSRLCESAAINKSWIFTLLRKITWMQTGGNQYNNVVMLDRGAIMGKRRETTEQGAASHHGVAVWCKHPLRNQTRTSTTENRKGCFQLLVLQRQNQKVSKCNCARISWSGTYTNLLALHVPAHPSVFKMHHY